MIWFRPRAERLFDFYYRIEIYTPEAQRKWGYYVLPFLLGDRIVARLDLKADRANGSLVVRAAHIEPGADREVVPALHAELQAWAEWLDLGTYHRRTTRRASGTFAALRAVGRASLRKNPPWLKRSRFARNRS